MSLRNTIAVCALVMGAACVSRPAWAQDLYTRTDVREAFERIERHGDEFKTAFKAATQNLTLSGAEKRMRDSVDDLENATDHLKKDFEHRTFQQARQDLDQSLLIASPINRFMLRDTMTPEASRAWTNLKGDLDVIAIGYGVPPLPNLLAAAPVTGPTVQTSGPTESHSAENRIRREVRHELVTLPYYGVFDNLEYRVEGNTVILMGEATNPTLKSDAEAAMRNIEGVERVVNNIDVLPPSPNDDRIRIATYRAIYGQPELNRYALQAVPPIHIIVDNGKVSLEGMVANAADKELAYIQAQGVPGVFSVTNHLRVENESTGL